MIKQLKDHSTALLRWSERYTGTDMVYLVHGGFWLTLAQVAASISGFILTTVLANLVKPELLGEYRFLLAGFSLISIIALPGMRTALRESTPKGYHGNLTPAFKAMFKWGLLGSGVALCVAAYYFVAGNTDLAIGFIIIALATPLNNSSTGYLEYLTALKKLRLTTVYTFIGRLGLLIATIVTAFLFPNYAWAIFAAYLFGLIIPNLYLHFHTVREFEKPGNPIDHGLTRYAWHITAMTALSLVAGQLDKIFVWNFIGAEGLALFYIAYTVPAAVSQYLLIIPTLAFAKFGEKQPETIRKTLLPKLFKFLAIIAVGAGMYVFVAPYIFQVLFSQYPNAVLYSRVLIATALFSAFLPIKTFLTTIKSTKALYAISIIPPALRIIVAVSLIAPFGLWGAVASLLVEGIIRSGLLLWFFLKTKK